jgi:hypothetical protein
MVMGIIIKGKKMALFPLCDELKTTLLYMI